MSNLRVVFVIFFLLFGFVLSTSSLSSEMKVGIVLLHGNGHPTKNIESLASYLKSNNILVSTPEMPFSSNRDYDKSVEDAVAQVNEAISRLKEQGANKIVISGHSKGGIFALYYATQNPVDGLIAIAPGGSSASKELWKKIGDSIKKAKKMVKSGKGDKVSSFKNYEGTQGVIPINTTAASYFSWFKKKGAMNSKRSARNLSSEVPVLWIVPTNDYKGLRKFNTEVFDLLPKNPKTKFIQPSADHKSAPIKSKDEILAWISEITK